MYSVLSTKICYRILARDPLIGVRLPSAHILHVLLESFGKLTYALAINGVGSHLRQPKLRDFHQQAARIMLALFPDRRVKVTKDGRASARPTPPVIPREPPKTFQRLRQSAFSQINPLINLVANLNHLIFVPH